MPITSFWGGTPNLVGSEPGWVTPDPTDGDPKTADLSTPPDQLDPHEFRSWTRATQVQYVTTNGAGNPPSLEVGPPSDRVRVAISDTPHLTYKLPSGEMFTPRELGRHATSAELAVTPSQLAPSVFLEWKREDQLAYYQRHASSAGATLILSGSGGDGPDTLTLEGERQVEMDTGVIIRSSGDYQDIPYHHLAGSASGSPSSVVMTSADFLFPDLDGDQHKLPVDDRPDGFYTAPSDLSTDQEKVEFLEKFSKWHSAYQLEYVKTHGTNGILDIQVTTPDLRLTGVVSDTDPTKLYIVQSLDKAAISRMSFEDQKLIAGTPAFADLGPRLGLTAAVLPVDGSSGDISMTQHVQDLIDDINDPAPSYDGQYKSGMMPEADRKVFTDQLEILKDQLATMAVVSAAEIQKKVSELRTRFERAFQFWDVKAPSTSNVWMENPPHNVPAYRDVISLDGDLSGINRGYQIFIAQERRIAELAEARMNLVRDNGVLNGQKLDVPYLVFKFQSLYNLSLEAQVVMETEEVNQQNDLLKTYAAAQDAVQQTLAGFSKASEGKARWQNRGADDYYYMALPPNQEEGAKQRKLIGMFESSLGTGQKHPLERLRNIERPLYNILQDDPDDGDGIFDDPDDNPEDKNFDLQEYSHTQWSTFSTRLSETVTLINQNSQIKMNDINSMDKQRNRHFELANNALSKMADIIASIARAS